MDIHRCRFVDYNPSPINALAFSHPIPRNPRSSRIPSSLRLAVGRANGTIEIWNPQANWLHESTLQPPAPPNGKDKINSIEGLVWIQSEDPSVKGAEVSRLFSIGGSTKVTEWDLTTGKPLAQFDCNKGVIWSIAAQPKKSQFASPQQQQQQSGDRSKTKDEGKNEEEEEGEGGEQLVVGCSDGSLVLISAEGGRGSMAFVRVLSYSKKARVLSLAYQDPNTILAGMSDSRMRVFDTRSNRIISTMGVGQDRGQKDVLLWSIKYLPGGTSGNDGGYIVAGDSRGELTLWDVKRYAMLQRVKAHEADILAIETSGNGNRIISTGIDRKTVVFDVVGKKHARKLVQVSGRRFHKHDVRAMTSFESGNMSVAISGGIDASPIIIPIHTWGKEFHRTLPAVPQSPIISTVPSARLLVAQFEREIKIWHIEDMNKFNNVESEDFDIFGDEKNRTLVGKIVPDIHEHIVASAISSNGHLLAVSTLSCIKLFHLRRRKSNPRLLRVSKIELDEKVYNIGARSLQFSPSGNFLCFVDAKSNVYQLKINKIDEEDSATSFEPERLQKLKRKDKEISLGSDTRLAPRDGVAGLGRGYERMIYRIAFSPDGSVLAASDLGGWIDCWKSDENGHWSIVKPYLPRLRGPAVAIGFRPALLPASANSPMRLAVENDISEYETLPSPNVERQTSLQLLHDQHGQLVEEKRRRLAAQGPSSRLFVLTAHHELHEFDVLEGRLTEWSKRNPSENLPERFRQLIDRGTGMVFTTDAKKETQRVWLWGASWVWMIDICRDIPRTASASQDTGKAVSVKRKRGEEIVADEKTAGAGRRMPPDASGGALAFRNEPIREFVGKKEITKKLSSKRADDDDDNSDEESFLIDPKTKKKSSLSHNEKLLISGKDSDSSSSSDSDSDSDSSSSSGSNSDNDSDSDSSSDSSSSDSDSDSTSSDDDDSASEKEDDEEEEDVKSKPSRIKGVDPMEIDSAAQSAITTTGPTAPTQSAKGVKCLWHTHKYRPLMAFAPIGGLSGDKMEMVVVERPAWDIQLPQSKFVEKRDVVR